VREVHANNVHASLAKLSERLKNRSKVSHVSQRQAGKQTNLNALGVGTNGANDGSHANSVGVIVDVQGAHLLHSGSAELGLSSQGSLLRKIVAHCLRF